MYISNLEPGTVTARKKLLQVGSIIVAVNGASVERQTVHEVLKLLIESHHQLELTVQLPTDYSTDHPYGESLLISEVITGSHELHIVDGDQFVVNIDQSDDDDDLGLQIVKRPSGYASFFFVKSIVPRSPAARCGKLMENDVILQVT